MTIKGFGSPDTCFNQRVDKPAIVEILDTGEIPQRQRIQSLRSGYSIGGDL